MKKIQEVIVVEGQNDINKVQECVDADIIKTNGTHLSQKLLKHLKELNEKRGIIIMTDDDYPGRWIRTQIVEAVGPCKHAFINKEFSKTTRKVGIEHASCEHVQKALAKVITLTEFKETISREMFIDLGLQGTAESASLRLKLCHQLDLPMMNAKRLYKTLNMMRITEEELMKLGSKL